MRLLGMWDSIDQSRALWPLTSTILLNLLRDRSRCAPRHDVVGIVPELESPHDVERAGLARVELDRVRRAMGHLSNSHRSVLMQELQWTDGGAASAAEKMLRMRARRKLRSILEKVSGLVVFRARRLVEFGDKVFVIRDGAATTASCVFCLVLGVGGVLVAPPGLTPKASARPVAPAALHAVPQASRVSAAELAHLQGESLHRRVADARREQAVARQVADREAPERSRRTKDGAGDASEGNKLPAIPIGNGDDPIPAPSSPTMTVDGDGGELTPPDPGDAPTVEPPSPPSPPPPPPPPVDAATPLEPVIEEAEGLLN